MEEHEKFKDLKNKHEKYFSEKPENKICRKKEKKKKKKLIKRSK